MESAKIRIIMRQGGYICLRLCVLLIAALAIVVYTSVPRMLMSQELDDASESSVEETASSESAGDGTGSAATGSVQKMGPVTSCGYDIQGEETDLESGVDDGVDVNIVQDGTDQEAASSESTSGDQTSSLCSGPRAQEDTDGDGVINCEDNCPSDPNPYQTDANGDGYGDACEDERQRLCNRGLLPEDKCQ